MNVRLASVLVAVSLSSFLSRAFSQEIPALLSQKIPALEMKHILTTLPDGKGRLRLAAMNIDMDRVASLVHLKGDVKVEMWPSPPRSAATVIRADEADYNELTGQVQPHGHVRVTVETVR